MNINHYLLPVLVVLLTCCARSGASESSGETMQGNDLSLPEFEEIMSKARSRLPDASLTIEGRLLTAQRLGMPEPICRVEIMLFLGREPAKARYTIFDMLDDPLEQMTITRRQDSEPEVSYKKGASLEPAPAPSLSEFIQDTDITWNDLTLSFLWDRHGTVVGTETRRSRNCFIVEFEQNGSIRLWIDDREFMIIQAEEYNAAGDRIRRLYVRSIRKIADSWMIKDLEIRRYPSMARTLLRIDDIIEHDARNEEAAEASDY